MIDTDGEAVVQIVGKRLGAQRRLVEALTQASATSHSLVIDLSRTSFIDSIGLKVLLDAWRSRLAAGHDMVLRDPSPAVTRTLEITGQMGALPVEITDPS